MKHLHIVNFHEYCPQCQHYEKSESEDPCWDCLKDPVNEDSRCPNRFEERKKKDPYSDERRKLSKKQNKI